MGAVTGDIPNLINGVSQQAMSVRLPTQGQLQENFYSTVVDGLKKRPPSEFVAKLLDAAPADAFVHIIDRDENERYVLLMTPTYARVYDFQGNQKTVHIPNGVGYLSGVSLASQDFKAVTVADYTFIVNRRKITQMSTAISPTRPHEALVNVIQGNYGRTFKINLNGSDVAVVTTGDGSATNHSWGLQTGRIASKLNQGPLGTAPEGDSCAASLDSSGINSGNGWFRNVYQNAVYIGRSDTTDFSIAVEDNYNGNAMKVVKGVTQKFENLPSFGPEGFVCEISGSDGTTLDSYWVKATKDGGNNSSEVIWKECPKPGCKIALDASTMPHILVREADGTFTFKQASWDERKCGDGIDIDPDPSFIGHAIDDVFFHRNRLGFLSDENVIMSRAGSFFDFFRTTATAVLDDDPIDVAASHVKVSLLKHAIPNQDYLLLMSSETQFRLAGNDLLTPKTVSIRPLTEYSVSTNVRPVAAGSSIFFVSESNRGTDQWAAVYEFFMDKSTESAEATEITSHVPAYIPGSVRLMVGSPDESVLAIVSNNDGYAIYIYRYYWSGEEKLQSSWSRWVMNGDVLGASFVNSELIVLLKRNNALYLERIRMDPAATDSEFGFLVNLDSRVKSTGLAAPTYDWIANTTTYTLPYAPTASTLAVGRTSTVNGVEYEVVARSGNNISLRGNTTAATIFFGVPYVSRWRFSNIFVRRAGSNGTAVTVMDGRLQIHHLAIIYDRTGYFRVEMTGQNREMQRLIFNGRIFGSPNNIIGKAAVDNGRFNVPVFSRNDRVQIDIVNDTWAPSAFISASWRGSWNSKGREL